MWSLVPLPWKFAPEAKKKEVSLFFIFPEIKTLCFLLNGFTILNFRLFSYRLTWKLAESIDRQNMNFMKAPVESATGFVKDSRAIYKTSAAGGILS